jgi:hypothetical protein
LEEDELQVERGVEVIDTWDYRGLSIADLNIISRAAGVAKLFRVPVRV